MNVPKFKRVTAATVGNTDFPHVDDVRDAAYFANRARESSDRAFQIRKLYGDSLPDAFVGGGGKGGKAGKGQDPTLGMEELYHILCDMRRDIKKGSDAQSLEGVKRWEKKKGDDSQAKDIDLNKDGIPEIGVFDPYGNPVMINGYTTKDIQLSVNYNYFSANPTAEKRKETSKRQYMDSEFKVTHPYAKYPGKVVFEDLEWVTNAREHNYRISSPRDMSPSIVWKEDYQTTS